MDLNRLVQRFLGAAIVLIVLTLAPSIAAAHPGHAHHGGTPVAAGEARAKSAKASAPAPAKVNTVQEARMSPALPAGTESNGPCLNGCCSGMPCSACAAVDIADRDAYFAHPPASGFIVTEVIARPGREPDGLIRPPQSFA